MAAKKLPAGVLADDALVLVKELDGKHRYLYKGDGVATDALDEEDVRRLLERGNLIAHDPSADDAAGDGDQV